MTVIAVQVSRVCKTAKHKSRRSMKTFGSILLLLSFVLIACMEESPTQAMLTLPNVEDILTYNEQYRDSIIAQTNGRVVIFHRDDGGLHVLLSGAKVRSATWTPNKRRILYSTPYELCLADANGNNAFKISHEREYILYALASPSGTKIAYIAIDTASTALSSGAIKVMNADGSSPSQLTPFQTSLSGLTWNPDSKTIIYILNSNGFGSIHQISIDDKSDRVLHSSPRGLCYTPAISRDGTSLAFSAWTDSLTFKISLLNMQSGVIQQLTTGNSSDQSPSWSPDGNALVYQRAEYISPYNWHGSSVWFIQKDGSNNVCLTTAADQCYDPSW